VGLNGQPAIFYKRHRDAKTRKRLKGCHKDFVAALKHMGIQVSANALEQVIGTLYPSGIGQDQDPNEVVSRLVRHFTRDSQNSV
jgi:hypothetical protein